MHVTLEGDRLDYEGITATDTESLIKLKVFLNITLSTRNAIFEIVYIRDLYYDIPMENYEYMYILMGMITKEMISQQQLE